MSCLRQARREATEHNRKSPLLSLPNEIKDEIYKLVLGGNILVYSRTNRHKFRILNTELFPLLGPDEESLEFKTSNTRYDITIQYHNHAYQLHPEKRSLDLSLLHACTQTYSQGMKSIFETNMFSMESHLDMVRLLSVNSEVLMQAADGIRYLRVKFDTTIQWPTFQLNMLKSLKYLILDWDEPRQRVSYDSWLKDSQAQDPILDHSKVEEKIFRVVEPFTEISVEAIRINLGGTKIACGPRAWGRLARHTRPIFSNNDAQRSKNKELMSKLARLIELHDSDKSRQGVSQTEDDCTMSSDRPNNASPLQIKISSENDGKFNMEKEEAKSATWEHSLCAMASHETWQEKFLDLEKRTLNQPSASIWDRRMGRLLVEQSNCGLFED